MRHDRVVVSYHGGPDVLQVVEEELPEPGGDEVRVRVLATGVSAFDLMYRRSGRLPGSPKVPFTLGEDIVGVVDELGEGVTKPGCPGRRSGPFASRQAASARSSSPSMWAQDGDEGLKR